MARSKGRSGRPWRRIRAQVLAEKPYCELRLDGCTGLATTVDHIIPIRHHGAPLERTNLRAACLHCNVVRGNQDRKQRVTSRRW